MKVDQQSINHRHKHVTNMVCSALLESHIVTRWWAARCIAIHVGGYIYKVFSEGADRYLTQHARARGHARGRAAIVAICG